MDRKLIFGFIIIIILILIAIYFTYSLNFDSVSQTEIMPVVNSTFTNKSTNTTDIRNNQLVFQDNKQSFPEGQEIILYSNPVIKEIHYKSKRMIEVTVDVNKTIYITEPDIQYQRLSESTFLTTDSGSNITGNYTQKLIIQDETIETWILKLEKKNGTWIIISSNKR